ncbi:MAG: hypothetical protein KIT36_01770 [Alphaproteobacteria bacterium]|nr:hypothetical protein [Alphaproteobacteria bacterium]
MDDIEKRLAKLEARVSSLAEMVERVTVNNANMLRAQQGVLDLQQNQTEVLRIIREELKRLGKAQDA